MTPEDRARELADSMAINKERSFLILDRVVLLVDDIVTYGTHFREAKRMLITAGARSVQAIALATAHGRPTSLS